MNNFISFILFILLVAVITYVILYFNNQNNKNNNIKWSCNSNICTQDKNGIFDTIEDCNKNCIKKSVSKYYCNDGFKCIEDDTKGTYDTIDDCNKNCKPALKYYCDKNTFKCIEDDTKGEYGTKDECDIDCCPSYQTYDTDKKICINKCKDDELYDGSQCKINCNGKPITDNEEIIKGKCVSKCPAGDNWKRCNYDCYDSSIKKCDSQGNICYNNQFYEVDGISKCCPGNQHYDTKKCTDCPKSLCGSTCCPENTDCVLNNCCDKTKIYIDKDNNKNCCPTDLCGGKYCCNPEAGEICIGGKCQIGCPDINNMSLYKCDGKIPDYDKNKLFWCDLEKNVCLHDCKDNTYNCIDKNKCWGNTIYDPALLTSNGQTYIYNNNNKKGSVSLCTTNNIDKWLSNTSLSDLKRNVFVEKGDTTLTCDVNSCIGKIQQDSSNIINFNKDGLHPEIIDGKCNSILSCSDSLLSVKDMTSLCQIFDQPNSNDAGRCCKTDEGTYTGQICGESETCMKDKNNNYSCVSNDKYCNSKGKLDQINRKCICDSGYAGKNCEFSRQQNCNNHANPKDDGTCDTCDYGYAGKTCQYSRQNCNNHANPKDDGTCYTCDTGYLGNNCQYSRQQTCNGHGDPNSNGVCTCDDKYKWNTNKLTCTSKTFIDYFNRDFLQRFLDDSKGFDALILIRVNSDPNFYPPKGQGDTSLPYWWNNQLADVAVSTIDTSGSRYNTNITIGDTVIKMHKCDTSSSGGAAYSHCLQLWPNDPNDKIYQNIYFKFYNWYDFKNRTTNNDDVDYANILIYSQYMYMDRSPNDMTPNDFNNANNNQNIFCVKRTPVCVVP